MYRLNLNKCVIILCAFILTHSSTVKAKKSIQIPTFDDGPFDDDPSISVTQGTLIGAGFIVIAFIFAGAAPGGHKLLESTRVDLDKSLGVSATVASTSGVYFKYQKPMRFRNRFKEKPRAMARDLKRLNGPQYKWLVNSYFDISQSDQAQFRCVLQKRKSRLNRLVKKASSLSESSIGKLREFLEKVNKEYSEDRCE